MSDSFPRFTNVSAPVAEDWWRYALVDRETQRTSRIAVGRPAPIPGDTHGDWYCPLSFEHYVIDVKCFMGVSPLDAFLRALRFVTDREREFEWMIPLAGSSTAPVPTTPRAANPPPDASAWQPRIEKIDDPVVEDWWAYALPDGSKRVSHILLGRPAPIPSGGDWYCPLFFEHITPAIECIYGVGPVDTLRNAAGFIQTRLDWFSFVSARSCPPGQRSTP
jgi:hypothetical protein